MDGFKDYYKILGVAYGSDLPTIREAYRKLSLKWHPDRNPGVDVTQVMQDINEAYTILKDEQKRRRYDAEYLEFVRQKGQNASADSFEVKDETLRQDMQSAREEAESMVRQFMKAFGDTSKKAASGFLSAAKPYFYVFLVLNVIVLIAGIFVNHSQNSATGNDTTQVEKFTAYQAPNNWDTYTLLDDRCSISIPPTMERCIPDKPYPRQLEQTDIDSGFGAIFQQKGLSKSHGKYDTHYSRVMLNYFAGQAGDYPRCFDTNLLEGTTKEQLDSLVESQAYPYNIIGNYSYSEVSIDDIHAIRITYRRTGNNGNTTRVNIYLLPNYDEMVCVIIAYREQEKDLWSPDLDNVIRTFRWTEQK